MFLANLARPVNRNRGVASKGVPFIPMATLPFTLRGMRLAMGNSFAAVVAAEMIAADTGLGDPILNLRLWMATEKG